MTLARANDCDTVMVLMKTNGGACSLQTIVFEPNSENEYGAFSTMCGNGMRAIAAYARGYLHLADSPLMVMTRSGALGVEQVADGMYRVRMGNIVTGKNALRAYANPSHIGTISEWEDAPIPSVMQPDVSGLPFADGKQAWSIGFNTSEHDPKLMDGEPHLVMELDGNAVRDIDALRSITLAYGPAISMNRELFPQDINVNFIAAHPADAHAFFICTFERNLGSNPEKCITQACGTGSAFAGALRMKKTGLSAVSAVCLGGTLLVEHRGDAIYLSGNVVRLGEAVEIKSHDALPVSALS